MSEVIADPSQIGAIVRKRRVQMNMTQAQLAEAGKVSRRTIILLEEGQAINIGFGKLMGILDALDMSISVGKAPRKRS